MTYGRPLKGGSRRVPITVHAPVKTIEIIDEYVQEYAESSGTAYSRSDFYQEAVAEYLAEKGIDAETGERNKSVTEKSAGRAN